MKSFKELVVWQKSIQMCKFCYSLTKKFPESEKFCLVSQINRCSVSIPSNIAEGWGRSSTKDYQRFLLIARGSICELETQLILSKEFEYIEKNELDLAQKSLKEISKMLSSLINSLK